MSKPLPDHVETKPCGCSTTTKPDGKQVFAPCVPCGIREAAQLLARAGQALGAVAAFINKKQNDAVMSMAVADAMEKKKP